MSEWDGQERRKDAIHNEHRFTILESIAQANQKGIAALEINLYKSKEAMLEETRLQTIELKEAIIIATTDIKTKVESVDTRLKVLELLKERASTLYRAAQWIAGIGTTTGFAGWFIHKAIKHGDKLIK